mgnify:CR=1 FL=1
MRTLIRKDEQILFETHKHWYVLILPFLFSVAVFALSLYLFTKLKEFQIWYALVPILGVIYFVYKYYSWKFDLWVVTNYRVIDEFGVFFPGRPMFRPTGKEMLNYLTPYADRSNKDESIPYTNCFEMWGKLETRGPKRQAYVPKITPIEAEHQYFPTDDQFQTARAMFFKPVIQEAVVEETTVNR